MKSLEVWRARRTELAAMIDQFNKFMAQAEGWKTQIKAKQIELEAAEQALLKENTDGDAH